MGMLGDGVYFCYAGCMEVQDYGGKNGTIETRYTLMYNRDLIDSVKCEDIAPPCYTSFTRAHITFKPPSASPAQP